MAPPLLKIQLENFRTGMLAILLLLLASPIEPAGASAADQSPGARTAFSALVAGDRQRARLVIELDGPIEVEPSYLADPDRIVLDLSRLKFAFVEAGEPVPRGLVKAISYGMTASGNAQLILELTHPALISEIEMREADVAGRYRLIAEFLSASPAAFANEVRVPASGEFGDFSIPTAQSRQPTAEPANVTSVVVLDPGHGGIDPGAVGGGGAMEKEVVLDVARRVASLLREKLGFAVFLTRDRDQFMRLSERVAFAKEKQASLFISMHADSLRQSFVRGATVHTLSRKASDRIAETLAQSESRTALLAGVQIEDIDEPVSDILLDLATRETKVFSNRFARLLVDELDGSVELLKNPHRFAAFRVLMAPDFPSALIELGFLSNAQDEQNLTMETWRQKVAERIAAAITRYFGSGA